jgi:hypothetical protein
MSAMTKILSQAIEVIEDNFEEMTMDEIFNGKDCYFPGLIPLVYAYLDYVNTDPETRKRVDTYLQFISRCPPFHALTYLCFWGFPVYHSGLRVLQGLLLAVCLVGLLLLYTSPMGLLLLLRIFSRVAPSTFLYMGY